MSKMLGSLSLLCVSTIFAVGRSDVQFSIDAKIHRCVKESKLDMDFILENILEFLAGIIA